jgi:transglutaminase-like putative cysteine protease
MRLAIRHILRFRFDEHAAYALQRLRLRPQSGPGQTVRAWQLTVDGVEPTLSYSDGLGNRVDLVRREREREEIVVLAAGVVDTQDRAGIIGPLDGYAPPWVFERETELTRAGDAVQALAAALPIAPHSLDALHWLMTEVHSHVAYAPGAGESADDAETVLRTGAGASRDHAHAFIAAARALRIPARYVSGYLLTDAPLQRIAEALQAAAGAAQSMTQDAGFAAVRTDDADGPADAPRDAALGTPPSGHAWAEAYVDGLGWVGFDPFMNRCPDERYVRIATGLDQHDALPVHGIGARLAGVEISVAQAPELV